MGYNEAKMTFKQVVIFAFTQYEFVPEKRWGSCAAVWWHNESLRVTTDGSLCVDAAHSASAQWARLFKEPSNRINRLWMDRSPSARRLIRTTGAYFRAGHAAISPIHHTHTHTTHQAFMTNKKTKNKKIHRLRLHAPGYVGVLFFLWISCFWWRGSVLTLKF